MTDLSLNELLDSVCLSKKQLAALLDVNMSTVTRMGDKVEDYVLEALDLYRLNNPAQADDVPIASTRYKPADDCTEAEIRQIWGRRGTESDYEIAHSLGVRVSQFRHDYIDSQVIRFN